jgi:site-specific DNA-methyltransferase (adenine-specific)
MSRAETETKAETKTEADGGPKPAADGDTGGAPTWGVHEICSLFPEMTPKEFADLKEHMAVHGQQELIVLHEGKVIDGRHRLKACLELGLTPKIRAWDGKGSLVGFVVGKNLHRRNLTKDQREACAAEALAALEAEAKQRQRAAGGDKKSAAAKASRAATSASGDGSLMAKPPQAVGPKPKPKPKPKSRDVAAAAFGVSARGVQDAKAVMNKSPELHEQVKAGTIKRSQAKRQLANREKLAAMAAKVAEAKAAGLTDSPTATVREVDSLGTAGLAACDPGSIPLICADPPYNIGLDYGAGSKADLRPEGEYLRWCALWLERCHDALTPTGSLWVVINEQNAPAFGCLLAGKGVELSPGDTPIRMAGGRRFYVQRVVVWYEKFGNLTTGKITNCLRYLFHCSKDPKSFAFNTDGLRCPSDRQAVYNDRRADPDGKIFDNLWEIPRVAGTHDERLPDFPTQLPLELIRRIITCSSKPGDVVLDPFSGSASTGVAALWLRRWFLGLELNPRYAELSRQRLAAAALDIKNGARGPFAADPEAGEPGPAA